MSVFYVGVTYTRTFLSTGKVTDACVRMYVPSTTLNQTVDPTAILQKHQRERETH